MSNVKVGQSTRLNYMVKTASHVLMYTKSSVSGDPPQRNYTFPQTMPTTLPATTSPDPTTMPVTTSPEPTTPPVTTSPETTTPPVTTSAATTTVPVTASPIVTVSASVTASPDVSTGQKLLRTNSFSISLCNNRRVQMLTKYVFVIRC